jgi:hypothetical protein
MNLPLFKLDDGTLVPAKGVTVHGSGIDGTAVAVIVDGVEHAIDPPQRVFDGDVLNATVGWKPPLLKPWSPPPPVAAPVLTLEQLEAELAETQELLDGLEDDDSLYAHDKAYELAGDIEPLLRRIAELKS